MICRGGSRPWCVLVLVILFFDFTSVGLLCYSLAGHKSHVKRYLYHFSISTLLYIFNCLVANDFSYFQTFTAIVVLRSRVRHSKSRIELRIDTK